MLDTPPMGGERCGFSVIGILGDMADLIARLDRVFIEEATVANLGMVAPKRAELSESHSPQVDPALSCSMIPRIA
jgi:hypothetical protein